MKIGETIVKLREEKNMSQEEFAQYYHVTRQTISNWENEKNYPDLQTLVKISEESGITIDSMLKENLPMVQEIDKKVKQLKIFKIGTVILIVIAILIASYMGIQKSRQTKIIEIYENKLEEIGFEQEGNNYSFMDANFRYDVYIFDKPTIWQWNQDMPDEEKFIVATLLSEDNDAEENLNVTIRKTKEFTTLQFEKESYMLNGKSSKPVEYSLDKNGQIKHKEKMNDDDREVYEQFAGEIEDGTKKLNKMYSNLYE